MVISQLLNYSRRNADHAIQREKFVFYEKKPPEFPYGRSYPKQRTSETDPSTLGTAELPLTGSMFACTSVTDKIRAVS